MFTEQKQDNSFSEVKKTSQHGACYNIAYNIFYNNDIIHSLS